MAVSPGASITYAQFLADPTRSDVYLFDVTVKDASGVTQTLRWSDAGYVSSPSDSPASTIWEPRVLSGGIDYESASFDFNAPQWGAMTPAQPAPLVVMCDGDEFDDLSSYRWASATIRVRHGGYTVSGAVALVSFAVIGIYDVDGVPVFDLDRVTFALRPLDVRLQDLAERRTCYGLGWCMGSSAGSSEVNFSPFAPGIAVRGVQTGSRGDGAGTATVIERPENVQSGDLLVAWIASHANDVSGTYQAWEITGAPAGWTQQLSIATPGSDPRAHRLYCYTKVAGASEALTYSFSGSGTGCNRTWCVTAYYGQDGTTPVVSPASSTGTTLGSTVAAPSVTPTTPYSVVQWAFSARSGISVQDPTGSNSVAAVQKNTSGNGNSSVLRVISETIASAAATGTRSWSGLSPTTLYAAGGIVISNRAPGGDPDKLILTNSFSAAWAMVPYSFASSGHLFGWSGSTAIPFAVKVDTSGNVSVSWTKATVAVSKTFTSITLDPLHRYHCDLIVQDTLVRLRVWDWSTEEVQSETITGTGFNGRDGSPDGDYVMLSGYTGQLWRTAIWSGTKNDDFLDDVRSRPLTESELVDSTLIHCVDFSEKTGTIVGDRAPDPAAGLSTGDEEWLPTLTGDAEVLGEQVPSVFGGPVRRCPAIMVDSAVNGPFWIQHPTAILRFIEISEGGAAREISGEYDDSTATGYHDFLTTDPGKGKFSTYIGALGSFYHCTTLPTMRMAATVEGEVDDSGVLLTTGADIALRVLTTRGEQPLTDGTEVDTAAFTALATDAPDRLGTMVAPGETIGDLLRRLLGSIGAVVTVNRAGKVTVDRWDDPVALSSGDDDAHFDVDVIERGSLKPVEVAAPVYQIRALFDRNFTPLHRDEISGDVATTPAILSRLMSEWRTANQKRHTAAALYPRGRELDIETCHVGPMAATNVAAECARMLDLQQEPGQAFEFSARSLEQKHELFDVVELHVTDIDDARRARSRLGTSASSKFCVVYIRSDRASGSEMLRVFRPRVAD